MRRSLPPISALIVWLAMAMMVHGQELRPAIDRSQNTLEQAFAEAKSPDLLGEFRRDATMRFTGANSLFALGLSADGQQHKAKAPQPEPVQRPPIDPSMVGYIDDALVRTEIRVRFDAALHDYTPDRAEYFYAKCGCYRGLPNTAVYDPNAPGPGSTPSDIPKYVNFQQLNFYGEYAFKARYSLFGTIPIRWLQPNTTLNNFSGNGGISDVEVGAKFAPFTSETHILTFQFASHLATGDSREGLGTHHPTIEPMVLYYQEVAGRASVEAQFGDTHPLGSSTGTTSGTGFAGDVLTYGIGGGYQLVQHEKTRVAGVLELVGWHILGGDVTNTTNPSTDGVNIVNLKVGPRVFYGEHHSFYFGYGIALTSATWYHEIFRTEYRYTF